MEDDLIPRGAADSAVDLLRERAGRLRSSNRAHTRWRSHR